MSEKFQTYEEFEACMNDGGRRREVGFRDGKPFFVWSTLQFERGEIEDLCATATAVRRLDRVYEGRRFLRGILDGRRVMNLFAQPSTRTAESFVAAAEKLGGQTRVVTDLQSSSLAKGESVEDCVRTLSSFFDMIVVRHADENFAARASWGLRLSGRPVPVISAGAGTAHHVTQSLLDIYTLSYSWQEKGGFAGKRVAIVGDIARNRAARSLAHALATFRVDEVDFVTSAAYAPDQQLVENLKQVGTEVRTHDSLEALFSSAAGKVDAIYMTRLQEEWDGTGHGGAPDVAPTGADSRFVLDARFASAVGEDCVIMHPLPRVNELPDDWQTHPGFVVWRQVRNGMWIRAALFAAVIGADAEIRARARRLNLVGRSSIA